MHPVSGRSHGVVHIHITELSLPPEEGNGLTAVPHRGWVLARSPLELLLRVFGGM